MAHGNILITGCDSGLGLEFVRYLSTLKSVNRVYAGYVDLDRANVNFLTLTNKQIFKELKELGEHPKVRLVKLLVDDDECIALAKAEIEAEIEEEGLNLLINNAAIHERVRIFSSDVISVDE